MEVKFGQVFTGEDAHVMDVLGGLAVSTIKQVRFGTFKQEVLKMYDMEMCSHKCLPFLSKSSTS